MGAAQTKNLLSSNSADNNDRLRKSNSEINLGPKSQSILNVDSAFRLVPGSSMRPKQTRLKSFSTVTNPYPEFVIKLGEVRNAMIILCMKIFSGLYPK